MAQICATNSCRGHAQKDGFTGQVFFPFPNDEELCRDWILRCLRYDLLNKSAAELNQSEFLCERHFENHCYESCEEPSLKANAKPTIFDHDTSQFEADIQEERGISLHDRPEVATVHYESLEDGPNIIAFEVEISKKEKNERSTGPMLTELEAVGDGLYINPLDSSQKLAFTSEQVPCVPGVDAMQHLDILVEDVETGDTAGGQQQAMESAQHVEAPPQQLCRVCAEQSSVLVPVFSERGAQLDLLEKIRWHLPIEVTETDKLPVDVCLACIEKLNSCHSLVNKCLVADAKLRVIYNIEDAHEMDVKCKKRKTPKRPPLPAQQLTEAMELLKMAKRVSDGGIKKEEIKEERTHISNVKNNPAEASSQQSTDVITDKICNMDETDVCEDLGTEETMADESAMEEVGTKDEIIEEEGVGERTRSSRRGWTCNICGQRVLRKSALALHQRMKHTTRNFSCSYCDKTFRSIMSMRLHERRHTRGASEGTASEVLVCEYCGRECRGRRALREHHLSAHREAKPYRCSQCNKTYGTMASLDIHLATHSSETPYLCDLCGKSFKHVSNLRSHKRSHLEDSDKNRQKCETCGKGFRSRFHLSEHMNVHLDRRPYPCPVCGKCFHKKIQLRQHSSAHSGTQPFECSVCGVRFNRRGNMTQHMKRHSREHKYVCRVCGQPFETLGAVLAHRKQHSREEVENSILQAAGSDDPEQIAFKCEVCGKLLAKKESLAIHLRTHTGEKLFECQVCGKRLSNKGSLTYHMRSFHTGERPHACQYCHEGFLSREARLVHERIHTGEKPYRCTNCGMGFRCSSNLAQHTLVHSDSRPFPCPHCDKRFQRKGALDVHLRTHTGERPFPCDVCSRAFSQKNDMLKHRKTHHMTQQGPGRRAAACDQCGQTFGGARELARHQATHYTASAPQIDQQFVAPTSPQSQLQYQCSECGQSYDHMPDLVKHQLLHLEGASQTAQPTTVLITADNIATFSQLNVPVIENTQTLILHRF